MDSTMTGIALSRGADGPLAPSRPLLTSGEEVQRSMANPVSNLLIVHYKKYPGPPLKRSNRVPNSWVPRACEAWHSGRRSVSGALISMLLNGGCGYEDLRFFPPSPVDGRFRAYRGHARPRQPGGPDHWVASLQYREERRGPVPHHHGGRGILSRRGRADAA